MQLLIDSGVVGWIILGMGLFALGVFFERLIVFRRESTRLQEFVPQFTQAVEEKDWTRAAQVCERHKGHIAGVYLLAVTHREQGPATLRNLLNNHIDLDIRPRLGGRLRFLNALGKTAPMLGLLGTVQGMIGAFSTIAGVSGAGVDPKQLAGDIGLALGTTFLGLLVAIPVTGMTAYLRSRVERFEVDLELYSDKCLDLLYPHLPPSVAAQTKDSRGTAT